MKIHLIRTPEYEIEHLQEVQELLNSFDGPLEFIVNTFEFKVRKFPFLNEFQDKKPDKVKHKKPDKVKHKKHVVLDYSMSNRNYRIKRDETIRWKDLYSLCKYYRKTLNIDNYDFVILLTSLKNEFNWFSHFDKSKNAFVHTGGWEIYTNAPQKFPVAYEVIECVLQQLMHLEIDQGPNPNLHYEPMGCMNDFCQNKQQVILKLRTADICQDCLAKMKKEGVEENIINQAIGIFEAIRTRLLYLQGFTQNQKPKDVEINPDGKIFIGGKEINLEPLSKTLFIFFLNHPDGTTLNDLQLHKQELLKIYKKLRPAGNSSSIDDLTLPYYGYGTFSKNKSTLNKKLKEQLGESLANFYYLDRSMGGVFRINIHHELVSVDIRY